MLSTAVADVYVCAGDIGVLSNIEQRQKIKEFFEYCKQNAKHIIWVLGNHEYYGSDMQEAMGWASRIADWCDVHLLDISSGTQDLEIDGVKFWGTTFWSDCHDGDWFAMQKAQSSINDFYVIKKDGRPFSVGAMREINIKSRSLVNYDADVIITHFAPMVIPHPKFPIDEISYYFCNTGLDDQIHDSSAKLWLYGHTHHSTTIDMSGTLVASNQHGYGNNDWQEAAGFDPNFILEI